MTWTIVAIMWAALLLTAIWGVNEGRRTHPLVGVLASVLFLIALSATVYAGQGYLLPGLSS